MFGVGVVDTFWVCGVVEAEFEGINIVGVLEC